MQRKKTYFITILLVTIFFLLGMCNITQAATASQTKYLKIMMLRESGFGYQALNKAVWEIVETNSSGTTEDHSATIYCIKGGPGFGSTEFGNGSAIERPYTQYFDLKDLDSISSTYRSALPSGNDYRALVWLLEHVYIAPANSSENAQAEEYRDQLLDAAGVNNGNLTDDDIDVVQQLAVWHFTNNDAYDAGDSLPELYINSVRGTNGNYHALTDEDGEGGEYGWDRQYDAEDLYDYLITEAERAASSGYEPQPASQPYELANTNITIEKQGSNYVIGPFRINQISDTTATLEGTFKNGNQTIHPTLQNASGGRFNNLQETVGQNFYIVLPQSTTLDTISLEISGSYYETTIEYWSVANAPSGDQPVVIVKREPVTYRDNVSFTPPEEPEVIFDLALRKYIASINGTSPSTSRVPQISSSTLDDLENGRTTTAEKIHPKTPLTVETGDNVIYTIRVYNEGNVESIVTEITDYLPEGLTLRTGSSINSRYGWTASGDGRTVTTNYLNGTVLDAFNGTTLDYADVQIECTVTARVSEEDTNLKNIAEITGATDSEGTPQDDRDSTPDNVDTPYGDESQEDDDDFEDLVILGKYFDFALRKYITQIDGESVNRAPTVDVSSLASGSSTTATYNHSKTPLGVKIGDEIIYTLRVYNEGQLDGYVTEITDYLPPELEYVNDSFNTSRGWVLQSDGRTVKTTSTSDELITAFNGSTLDYAEVQIKVRVKESATSGRKLTNIAEITGFTDASGETINDRDSVADNVTLPSDPTLPNYKDTEINRGDNYIPGQQDDDDFEKVVVEKFDLALRKFITGVNAETINNREPVFHNDNGNYTYEHTKNPVLVKTGDTVIYTLRIYNEGDIAGYAEEVKDDIPEGLEFLPENTTNINYRWEMYDAQGQRTDNVAEAVTIRTDYLSKAQADATRRDNLIEAFDPDTMSEPDYKEVRVAFKVVEPSSSDRVIINTAEISEDSDEDGNPVDDTDSTPDNDDEEEDDTDIEKVVVQEFDLALRKFITHVNGTEVQTSREPQISMETIQKLINGEITTLEKLHTKTPVQVNTNDVIRYTIRIYNEGDIAGYASEVTDYLPEGLEFVEGSQINNEYGWSNPTGDGKTIVTDYLATRLLNGVEGTDVRYWDLQIECRVVATSGSSQSNLKNVAEITKATDEEGNEVPDRDSEEDNLTEEEKNNYNPGESEKGWGYEDDDDYEELVIPGATGEYEIKIIKENGLGNKLAGATFKVEEINAEGDVINTYDNLTTSDNGEVVTGKIPITGEGTHTYIITELEAPNGYQLLTDPIRLEIQVQLIDGVYTVTASKVTRGTEQVEVKNGAGESTIQNTNYATSEVVSTSISLAENVATLSTGTLDSAVNNIQMNGNTVEITVENNYFDLALRKFITHINNNPVATREPVISPETIQNLANRTITTAEKNHTKTPVQVNTGDIVRYTIRVYNEGEMAGYATEITDYLPDGLEFVDSEFNRGNGWSNPNGDGKTIVTTALAGKLIDAFNGSNVDYEDIQIECRVVAQKGITNINLKNVAEITKATDEEGSEVDDRDSQENDLTDEQKNNYNPGESEKGWGYEDDDDYEELTLPGATGEFNIKLIKVNGLGNRLQNAIFKIEEIGENGEVINTYDNLTTNENGEITISNIAIAQEGTYTYIITETQAPEGYTLLEGPLGIEVHVSLVNGEYQITANQIDVAEINKKETEEKKVAQTTRRTITTNYWLTEVHQTQEETSKTTNVALADNNAKAEENAIANVLENAQANLANQRSVIKNLTINNNTVEITIENNFFDLALRKFITGVNEEPITNRVPVFHNNNGEYTYEHTKDPVEVANGDVVIYTLRIYNEGEIAGYAEEVKDDLPEGLEFLPENSINTEYRWVMYDANGEVTENVAEAVSIRTDYLSKAQADATGRDNLIEAFDPETMTQPDYKDIQIAFRVTEPNTSDRILINTAEISEDADEDGEPVDDIDSTPDNDEEEEDDIDIEKVKVTYFDLALKKIISTLTMELDGKTYVEQTGHTFEDDPEEIVKIELGSNQIERATFKFTYQIRITNEGNKAGYAYEIKDYIPEGLEFVAEDNEGWVLNEDGTVTTDQLSDVLLEPGESVTIEITLRWINKSDNLGVKTNWAEISEDSDDDIDSTPDNEVPGEDDIDDASVVLSIVTGVGGHNIAVIAGVLVLLGTGVILIKKFVL